MAKLCMAHAWRTQAAWANLSCSECGKILCHSKLLQNHKKSDHNYAQCEECGGEYLKHRLDHHKLWAYNLWPETSSVKDNLIATGPAHFETSEVLVTKQIPNEEPE